MKMVFIFFLLFYSINFSLRGQSVPTGIGGRSAGMGYAMVAVQDEWAMMNNVGGLARITRPVVAVAEEVHPGLQGANRAAFTASAPLAGGVGGLSLFRFGDEVYNEQVFAAGFGNSFGIASLGLKLNVIQYRAQGYSTKNAVTLSFGGIAVLTPWLIAGASIDNLNQPKISRSHHENVPASLSAGLCLKASKKFLFAAELQKDIDYTTLIKAGLEYFIHPRFTFRTGIHLHPDSAFFGFGFQRSKMKFDYGLHYNTALGSAQQLSVIYRCENYKPHR